MTDSQALTTPPPRPGETQPAAVPGAGGTASPGNDAPAAPNNGPATPQEPGVTIEQVSGWAMGGSD